MTDYNKSTLWAMCKDAGLDESKGIQWSSTEEDMVVALREYHKVEDLAPVVERFGTDHWDEDDTTEAIEEHEEEAEAPVDEEAATTTETPAEPEGEGKTTGKSKDKPTQLCKVCGHLMAKVTKSHIKTHGMTEKDYNILGHSRYKRSWHRPRLMRSLAKHRLHKAIKV